MSLRDKGRKVIKQNTFMQTCQLDHMQTCSMRYQIMMQGKYEMHGGLDASDLQGKHFYSDHDFIIMRYMYLHS